MSETPLVLTAHQPVYLPWLGLLHKIALSDAFVYFDDVQYQDRDWNNRNKVKTSSGPVWLTVPVFNKDHFNLKLKDTLIVKDDPWRRKHWKTIKIAYAKAPFASRYLPYFDALYEREWEKLSDLNEDMLRFFLREFGISVPFSKLSEMNLSSKKSDLVLEMCVAKKASLYIFGAQGRDYADQKAFHDAGVKVEFQDYHHPFYTQQHGDFVSHMAALDLLMNHGPKSYEIMMSGNVTREELRRKHFETAALPQ